MRKGINPNKKAKLLEAVYHHRVVIPVYIPDSGEDYYSELDQVLKLCVESLVATADNRLAITLVNNGSHDGIREIMDQWHRAGIVDTVIHHAHNIGKIDALIGAARGAREPLITLCDADIFFRRGWQKAVEEVFLNFPEAGSVSPIPIRTNLFYYTSPVLWKILLGKYKFRFLPIPENASDFNRHLKSINWEVDDSLISKKWPVIFNKKGFKAIVGSSHPILTVKRNILHNCVPNTPSLRAIGGGSEQKYIDEPIEKSGLLRLSTFRNFAWHIGNKPDQELMNEVWNPHPGTECLENRLLNDEDLNLSNVIKTSKLQFKLLKKLSQKLFYLRYGIADNRY